MKEIQKIRLPVHASSQGKQRMLCISQIHHGLIGMITQAAECLSFMMSGTWPVSHGPTFITQNEFGMKISDIFVHFGQKS